MRSQICAEIIVQAFRGFITFLILVHHRFSDAYNKMNVAVGSERGYRTLDLHPKASQNADLRGPSEWYRKDSVCCFQFCEFLQCLTRRSIGAAFSERAMFAYHAGVFCIPLPTHARLARDYRPHVDRATPGDPPCRSATPSPEVVRSIC